MIAVPQTTVKGVLIVKIELCLHITVMYGNSEINDNTVNLK